MNAQYELDRIAARARSLYTDLGLSIFPVHHPMTGPMDLTRRGEAWSDDKHSGKLPSVAWKRFQSERPTEDEIGSWFMESRLHNIGLPTGPLNGVVVVDCDSEESLAWALRNLPETPLTVFTSATSSGARKAHRYYAWNPERPIGNKAKVKTQAGALQLDIRGEGGFVLAPGSMHRLGLIYDSETIITPELLASLPTLPESWIAEDEFKRAPARPERLQVRGETYHRAALYASRRENVAEGGRDNAAYRLACAMVNDFGLDNVEALAILSDWNARNNPPLSESDLERKIASARKSARGNSGRLRDEPLRFQAGGRQEPPPEPPAWLGSQESGGPGGAATARKVAVHPHSFMNQYVTMDTVARRMLEFLCEPYLPKGEVTIVSGPGGRGKSLGVASIASHVSRGSDLCGKRVQQGKVLFFSAEDDPDTILLPRLQASGADLSQVVARKMDFSGLVLDESGIDEIRRASEVVKPALIIIDPIVNFMTGGLDMNRSNQVAALMKPLVAIAKQADCAVLIVVHHNKADGIMGSVQFVNSARSVLTCYEDPVCESGNGRYLAHVKCNYTKAGDSLRYEIEQLDENDSLMVAARFTGTSSAWTGGRLHEAQSLDGQRESISRCCEVLIAELSESDNLRVKVRDIRALARGLGYSDQVLKISIERACIVTEKTGGEYFYTLRRR